VTEPAPFEPKLTELLALRERVAHLGGRIGGPLAAGPGAHRSAQPGRGMEFAGVRRYQPGDDARSLDWRHTARHGRPYTKLFHEERERPVLLFVDLGPGMRFGSRAFKSAAAARGAAVLAWAAVSAGDRVGGVVCDGAGHHVIRPQAREQGALALVRRLAEQTVTTAEAATGLAEALEALARLLRPGTAVVVVSDFLALDAAAETALERLARRAALGLVHVFDPIEAEPPPVGIYRITDGTRERVLDLRSTEARAAYGQPFRERRARLAALARGAGARLVGLATDDDPVRALPALLGRRGRLSDGPSADVAREQAG